MWWTAALNKDTAFKTARIRGQRLTQSSSVGRQMKHRHVASNEKEKQSCVVACASKSRADFMLSTGLVGREMHTGRFIGIFFSWNQTVKSIRSHPDWSLWHIVSPKCCPLGHIHLLFYVLLLHVLDFTAIKSEFQCLCPWLWSVQCFCWRWSQLSQTR